jgi:hypothetical protein
MRVGEGLALPLPSHLAAALGLKPGDEVEIRGPSPDGCLRYVPGRAAPPPGPAPASRAPVDVPVPASEAPTVGDVSAEDVVRAIRPGAAAAPESGDEIDVFVARHAGALREAES